MRIAGCVEYCGKQYCGWQYQPDVPSVQNEVQKAIALVADHEIVLIAAGRTDTGVHGIGQIVHFNTLNQRTDHAWLRGVNSNLPNDIALIWTQSVSDNFHARFSAKARSYRYIILNRRVNPSYLNGLVTWHRRELNIDIMRKAAQHLIGKHDFEAYRAIACQSKVSVKEIYSLQINQSSEWIWLDIRANGFLHHMVRNIVGVLMKIGEGFAKTDWSKEVLESRDRSQGGVTAPADGLYLSCVEYDASFDLPDPPSNCRFW